MKRLSFKIYFLAAVLIGIAPICFANEIPENARLSASGNTWLCLSGYHEVGDECKKFVVKNGEDITSEKALIPMVKIQLAKTCLSDTIECTPQKLCEASTETQDGNKVWSTSNAAVEHVLFAQKLGMTCGVVEVKDPCYLDPNEWKINQLCEKAITVIDGVKSWNLGAEDYVLTAKQYGFECAVLTQTTEVAKPQEESTTACLAKAENLETARSFYQKSANIEQIKEIQSLFVRSGYLWDISPIDYSFSLSVS